MANIGCIFDEETSNQLLSLLRHSGKDVNSFLSEAIKLMYKVISPSE